MAIADRIVHSRKKKTPEQTTAQNLPQIWVMSTVLNSLLIIAII
jgi:hypothetical protein